MVTQSPSNWKLYYINEVTAGTTPSNPAFLFAGYITSGEPSPKPTIKQIRASGSQHFAAVQQLKRDPEMPITFIPATVAILTNFINTDQYGSFVARDSTNSQYVRLLGGKVDSLRGTCDINDNLSVDLGLKGFTMDNTAPTLGSGSYASDATGAGIAASDITVSKAGSALTDWTRINFGIEFNLIPLYDPTTGIVRSLERGVATDHSFSVARVMDTATAFDEMADINAKTTRTMKVKVDNPDDSASWSMQLNSAQTSDFTANLFRPEDIVGKEIPYLAATVTLGTS